MRNNVLSSPDPYTITAAEYMCVFVIETKIFNCSSRLFESVFSFKPIPGVKDKMYAVSNHDVRDEIKKKNGVNDTVKPKFAYLSEQIC